MNLKKTNYENFRYRRGQRQPQLLGLNMIVSKFGEKTEGNVRSLKHDSPL